MKYYMFKERLGICSGKFCMAKTSNFGVIGVLILTAIWYKVDNTRNAQTGQNICAEDMLFCQTTICKGGTVIIWLKGQKGNQEKGREANLCLIQQIRGWETGC